MQRDAALFRFIRGLIGGTAASRQGERYCLPDGRSAAAATIVELIRSGAIAGDSRQCAANDVTSAWLKRALLDQDAFRAQHQITEQMPDGRLIDLTESPLRRLALGPSPFLSPHHVEAGERVRSSTARSQLSPRTTMNYSPTNAPSGHAGSPTDLSDMALDARRALADIHRLLPRDCAGVVIDVCGFLKGLQEVERDRGWPRRSAKLVLRIGLDQLAQHYGLTPIAVGKTTGRARAWLDEGARPDRFG